MPPSDGRLGTVVMEAFHAHGLDYPHDRGRRLGGSASSRSAMFPELQAITETVPGYEAMSTTHSLNIKDFLGRSEKPALGGLSRPGKVSIGIGGEEVGLHHPKSLAVNSRLPETETCPTRDRFDLFRN